MTLQLLHSEFPYKIFCFSVTRYACLQTVRSGIIFTLKGALLTRVGVWVGSADSEVLRVRIRSSLTNLN
jgi:hypothetical protein